MPSTSRGFRPPRPLSRQNARLIAGFDQLVEVRYGDGGVLEGYFVT